MLSRAHDRVQADVLTFCEPVAQYARVAERDHEREGRRSTKCIEMAPSHEGLILFPPRRVLIRRVADDSCRAVFCNGNALYGVGLRSGENDFAFDILAGVIVLTRTFADI